MERAHCRDPRPDHASDPPWQLPRAADGLRQRRFHARRHAHWPAARHPAFRRSHGAACGTRLSARHRLAPAPAASLNRTAPHFRIRRFSSILAAVQPGHIQRRSPMSRISALQALALCLALSTAPTALNAQGIIHTQKLSAQLANELVGESVATCAKNGYKVVAVVVDLDGVRQALLRGDGAPIHSMDNAYYTAYTIASLGLART